MFVCVRVRVSVCVCCMFSCILVFVFAFIVLFSKPKHQSHHPLCPSPLGHQLQNVTRVAGNKSIGAQGWAQLLPSLAALTALQVLRLHCKFWRWSKSRFLGIGVWSLVRTHVAHRTSPVTRHTSHVKRHTSCVMFGVWCFGFSGLRFSV